MHRAGLPQKVRAKSFEDLIGIHQDTVKTFDVIFIVRGMMMVLIEGSGISKLRRFRVDVHLDSQRPQACHVLVIEIRNGTRDQGDAVLRSFASPDGETMRDEIKLYLECLPLKWNRRRVKAARGDIEWNVPPMVLQGRERHAGLAHDLRP